MDTYVLNGHTPQGWRIVRRPRGTGPAFPDPVAFVPNPEMANRIVELLNADAAGLTRLGLTAEEVAAGGPIQSTTIVPGWLSPDVVGSIPDLDRPPQPPLREVPPLDADDPFIHAPPLDLAQVAPEEPDHAGEEEDAQEASPEEPGPDATDPDPPDAPAASSDPTEGFSGGGGGESGGAGAGGEV